MSHLKLTGCSSRHVTRRHTFTHTHTHTHTDTHTHTSVVYGDQGDTGTRLPVNLESREDGFRDQDQRHGIEETEASGERNEKEGEKPPSRDPGNAGDPVGDVVLSVHCTCAICALLLLRIS